MRLIFLLLVLFTLLACEEKQEESAIAESKAGKVPAKFVLVTDSALSTHQDSVYYKAAPFSGMIYLLTEQRDTLLIEPYLNGIKEGFARKWYANRQIAEERFYISGKKEGTHKGWWPNGNKQYQFMISNDEYQDEFREWNNEGRLIKLFHYKKGHEDGRQQLWYDDGKVRANYVITDGRRFGLLGTKNCINVSDSVFKK